MIRPEDQRLLQPFLLPGERLLWTGRPRRGFSFQLQDLWGVAFLGAWIGLNVLMDGVLEDWPEDPLTFGLVAGLLIVTGTRLYEPWLRRHLLYAVTNKRVAILRGGLRPELRTYDLGWLPKLDLEQQGPDRGSIVIATDGPPARWRLLPKDVESEISEGFRFCRIENPTAVYDLICRSSRDRCLELNRDPVDDSVSWPGAQPSTA